MKITKLATTQSIVLYRIITNNSIIYEWLQTRDIRICEQTSFLRLASCSRAYSYSIYVKRITTLQILPVRPAIYPSTQPV